MFEKGSVLCTNVKENSRDQVMFQKGTELAPIPMFSGEL